MTPPSTDAAGDSVPGHEPYGTLIPPPDLQSPDPPAEPSATLSPPAPPAGPPMGPPTRGGGIWHWMVAGLIGGIVGALVAGGIFVVVDDGSTTIVRAAPDAAISRPARSLPEGAGVAAIIARVEPAVVAITTDSGPGSGNGGAGTGFVITADGFVVTNNHVVEDASRIAVGFTNGDEKQATLVGREPASDLAVLRVEGSGLATVELCDSDDAQVGDEVVAIGNALALDGGLSITRGIVSGLHRTVSTNTGVTLLGMMQTDAAINPGNSGGPLVAADGCVLAINTAIANPQSANNVGFAIPMANARPVIDDLRLGRPAAFLGVATLTVTPAVARQQDLSVNTGALVTRVTAGSAAAGAGIQDGDVIVAIAGEPVTESSDVQALVRGRRPGDSVDIVVHRDGNQRTVRATLTERPAT